MDASHVNMIGNQFEELLQYRVQVDKPTSSQNKNPSSMVVTYDPTSHQLKLQEAFRMLVEKLRSLSDVPLSIISVQAVHPGKSLRFFLL